MKGKLATGVCVCLVQKAIACTRDDRFETWTQTAKLTLVKRTRFYVFC